MRKHILIIILLISFVSGVKGQIPESNSFLSFSVGKLIYGGQNQLFFPSGINNHGYSFRADYLKKCLPWMKIGVEGSCYFPNIQFKKDNEFLTMPNPDAYGKPKVTSYKENILTAGVNATFFLPYKDSGWRNRLRFQVGVAPVIVMYNGSRTVSIGGVSNVSSDSKIKGPSNRFGLSITPALEYYMKQRSGIKLSMNTLSTSLKSNQGVEKVTIHSLDIGVFFSLSRDKKLNY